MTRTQLDLEPRSAQRVLRRKSVLWHAPGSVFCVREIARPSLSPLRTTLRWCRASLAASSTVKFPNATHDLRKLSPHSQRIFSSSMPCFHSSVAATLRTTPDVTPTFCESVMHTLATTETSPSSSSLLIFPGSLSSLCSEPTYSSGTAGALQRLQHPSLVSSVLQLEISTEQI